MSLQVHKLRPVHVHGLCLLLGLSELAVPAAAVVLPVSGVHAEAVSAPSEDDSRSGPTADIPTAVAGAEKLQRTGESALAVPAVSADDNSAGATESVVTAAADSVEAVRSLTERLLLSAVGSPS